MFKLSKYELRKNIFGLLIMLGAIVGLEIYFVISALVESRNHTATACVLLIIAAMLAYFGVLIYGVVSYSKELNSKTGYMTFMTPISSFTVIGSKLFSTLVAGIFFVLVLAVFAIMDMAMFENVFPESRLLTNFIEEFSDMIGMEGGEFWITAIVNILNMLIESIAIVAVAYLAITLTATIFQNKKWKGIVSILIFLLVMVAVVKVAALLPDIYEATTKWSQGLINLIPIIVYMAAVSVASIYVSGKLLDKKVSL